MTSSSLDALDRRIVAALQVDGRATWRHIAAVLGAAERTVTRRGTQLLAEGIVEIHGLPDPHRTAKGDPFIVNATCAPGSVMPVAIALARRPEAVVMHILTGSADCFVDLWCPQTRLSNLLLNEIGSIPGLVGTSVSPVLRYIKTVHDWDPGILSPDEVAAIRGVPKIGNWPQFAEAEPLNRQDRLLMAALIEDGRISYEELGRLCGISEQTAARRLEVLRRTGLLAIRALVEPRLLGLPIGALLRIRTAPARVERVAEALAASSTVRYAALVMGNHQLIADVRLPSKAALSEFLVEPEWLGDVASMETSLIIETLKQSGVLASPLR